MTSEHWADLRTYVEVQRQAVRTEAVGADDASVEAHCNGQDYALWCVLQKMDELAADTDDLGASDA